MESGPTHRGAAADPEADLPLSDLPSPAPAPPTGSGRQTLDSRQALDLKPWRRRLEEAAFRLLPPPLRPKGRKGAAARLALAAALVLVTVAFAARAVANSGDPLHQKVSDWVRSNIQPDEPYTAANPNATKSSESAPSSCPHAAPSWQDPVPPFQDPDLGNCGNWQADYARLHAEILAGGAPQRYVVVGGIGGLADCLVGAITAFYHALLTDRAFQMRIEFTEPKYEWGYDINNIDWRVANHGDYPVIWDSEYNQNYPEYDEANSIAYFRMYFLQKGQGINTLTDGNIFDLARDYRVIYWEAGSGYVKALFENKFAIEKLTAMGLRPETAFGCAMQFLMQPTAEVRNMFAPEAAALADEETLKIGIQIRLGDHKMFGEDKEIPMEEVEPWFRCAKTVAETRRVYEGQRVLYYVISDSKQARSLARQYFGDEQVLTDTNRTVSHIIGHVYHGEVNTDLDAKVSAYQTSVGENWAFGLTDFQVTAADSGFGKLSGIRALHSSTQYQIHDRKPRWCGIHDYDLYHELAATWSMV